MKKTEAHKAAQQTGRIRPAGQSSVEAATGVASGNNRVMLGHRPLGTAKEVRGSEAELVDGAEE